MYLAIYLSVCIYIYIYLHMHAYIHTYIFIEVHTIIGLETVAQHLECATVKTVANIKSDKRQTLNPVICTDLIYSIRQRRSSAGECYSSWTGASARKQNRTCPQKHDYIL